MARVFLLRKSLRVYLTLGKAAYARFALSVFLPRSSLVNARRMARVFLLRKSLGTYLAPSQALRSPAFCCWLWTVKTRAMDFRTDLILAILEAAPSVTLATCNSESSLRRSVSVLRSSSLDKSLNSYALTILEIVDY